ATKNAAGQATSSKIGRQAIDHLQATSLADLMQLLPGQLLKENSFMTSPEQFYLRTLRSDANNAFGVSIMVDGMPMSNNTNLNSNEFNVVGGGYDLRKIGTDNIESVEVIRGVPSVEYGDLSAGAVIVKTSTGESPWHIRAKVNPSIIQSSLNKGWKLGKKRSTLNGSFDYLRSSGDPRLKTRSFDRVNGSLAYSNTLGIWRMTTRAAYSGIVDNAKQDPDEVDYGIYTKNKDYTLKFSHEGSFAFNRALSRTLRYNVGYTMGRSDYFTSAIVSSAMGRRTIYTAKEEGIHEAIVLPASYSTSGGTIGKPENLFSKASNEFFVKSGILNQRFNMGVEYQYSRNRGKGDYNTNDALPLKPTSARPRGFWEIPALHQLSAYFEDNISLNIKHFPVKIQAGVRYTNLQPGKDESVWSLSPRVNVALSPAEWLDVKAAFGKNAKTPGLTHLYPDLKYVDRTIVNYGTGNPDEQLMMYDTRIIKVDNSKLKNSTTTRYEVGFDVKLPKGKVLSVSAFQDRNDLGFGGASNYVTYAFDYYDTSNGGVVPSGEGKPAIDYSKPCRRDTVMTTTGETGNTSGSLNKGIEFDFEFGRINPIRTNLYFRGGYMRTESYSSKMLYSRPVGYSGDSDTPPLLVMYPSKRQKDIQEQFSTQLQAVCHIPRLKMVASAVFQVVWYSYSKSTNLKRVPVGYLTNKLEYREITEAMLNNPDARIEGYLLKDQIIDPRVKDGMKQPPLCMLNLRLTK
ncbi:MAG: TonB-dependent receptor plug domain-containing protein, partial [Odoribacter sp.]|nr:TonB-dependent receptor plug domain-containing protein [Odoribacter sp.]